jgi:lipopolysaccharide export system permease protein
MQFFWLYIDDLVGKGLDVLTILKLISLVAATATPLALPLALLLSSIMTFGNLGETFELVAIKSAGIPLLRFMRPLFIVSVFISIIAFLFENNLIPVANLKLDSLKYDIIVKKPAFDMKEGVFFDKIEGYVIKVGKKEKDDSTIRNVVIYEKTYGLQDQFMIAESGTMKVNENNFLEFKLHNGWSYQENGDRYGGNTEYIRLGFKEYKKDFDLSTFKMNKTQDSLFYDPKMLSIRQLNKAIDSLGDIGADFRKKTRKITTIYLPFERYSDSVWPAASKMHLTKLKSSQDLIPDSMKTIVFEKASSSINGTKSTLQLLSAEYESKNKLIRKHWIEWHRKFTLSVACIVLFMIGAPLGSIIRKGGLGTPLIFAIIFFVTFHLLNTFGEKFAKTFVTSSFVGMWLSTAVLIPIGIFLTYKAMRDSQLFNKEFYFRAFRKIRPLFEKVGILKHSS